MAPSHWLTHKGCRWVLFGWTAFIAENLVLSENREAIIERINAVNYHRMYNTLSTMACASIAYGYFRYGRRQRPMSYGIVMNNNVAPFRNALGRVAVFSLQAVGLAGIYHHLPKLQIPIAFTDSLQNVGSATTTTGRDKVENASLDPIHSDSTTTEKSFKFLCPINFKAKGEQHEGIYGPQRITRHPMLFSLGLASIGTAMYTPFICERILFGFPLLFACIGGAHQDRRFLRSGQLDLLTYQNTSLLPFHALVDGRQEWDTLLNEIKWVNVACGVSTAALLAIKREVSLRRMLKK